MQRHVNATRVDDLPGLEAGVVADLHLLLLVHLPRIDELLDRARAEQTVHGNVARLPEPVRAVHRLQVVGGV